MTQITNFAIFKNSKKEKETQPDYTMSIKVGEEYVTVAGLWLKEGKTGKFFSGKFSEPYNDRKGYVITEAKNEVVKETKSASKVPYPTEDIDPASIPF